MCLQPNHITTKRGGAIWKIGSATMRMGGKNVKDANASCYPSAAQARLLPSRCTDFQANLLAKFMNQNSQVFHDSFGRQYTF